MDLVITETRINNIDCKPFVKKQKIPPELIKGGDILAIVDGVSYFTGQRGKGKTVVFCNCARMTSTKKTHIWYFSPTAETDDTALKFKEVMTKRGNLVNSFETLRGNDGTDMLLQLYNSLHAEIVREREEEKRKTEESEWETIEEIIPGPKKVVGGVVVKEGDQRIVTKKKKPPKKKKPKKPSKKKIGPRHLFIIDDLSTFLKQGSGLDVLIKNGRHIGASVYISVQYKNDIPPDLWANCNYMFLFSDVAEEKIEEIFKTAKIANIVLYKLLAMFQYAMTKSKSKYPFFMIERDVGRFRMNFKDELTVPRPEIDEMKEYKKLLAIKKYKELEEKIKSENLIEDIK